MSGQSWEVRIDPELLEGFLRRTPGVVGRLWDGGEQPARTEMTVPAVSGGTPVRVRVYRPTGADGPLPGVVFVHGGGFTVGPLEWFDTYCDWYSSAARAVVISVGYRLAPAHTFPAPLDDLEAVWRWLHQDPEAAGIDPGRLVLAGSSAGAAIAAGFTLRTRDSGGSQPRLLLLHGPVLDDRHQTASSREATDPRDWNRSGSLLAWEAYLGCPPGSPGVSVYAAPGRAPDVSGLPPTFVSTGGAELARDEAVDFSVRLAQAGVPVELHVYPGAMHGFDVIVPDAALSVASRSAVTEALRRALGTRRAVGTGVPGGY